MQTQGFLHEYLPIALFFFVAILVSCVAINLPRLFSTKKYNEDKSKTYECGFDAFDEARSKFDVRFYLIAVLFIIFDLEIMFLVPWAVSLGKIGLVGFLSMMFFLFVLVVGFVYELKKGALQW